MGLHDLASEQAKLPVDKTPPVNLMAPGGGACHMD
jgi:hypothetical protein